MSEPFIHAEDADALKRLGQTHLQQRNFDLAVQCFRRGIALRPDSPSLWSHLGIALQESGQSKEAIESFRKACAAFDPRRRNCSAISVTPFGNPGS